MDVSAYVLLLESKRNLFEKVSLATSQAEKERKGREGE